MPAYNPVKLGISSCLLGENVRYDGQHKLDRFLRDTLGTYVQYVPVCPEYECGLGIPREAMRLVGDPEHPRLMTRQTGKDLTEQMERFARERVEALAAEDLCGFIFKSKSPSSGMERVKVYSEQGMPAGNQGVGIFARIFMERFPLLPVEEEGRLHDVDLRENFIERIFVAKRWKDTVEESHPDPAGLIDFHTRHKLLLMAHSPSAQKELGKLVAASGSTTSYKDLCEAYRQILLPALEEHATTGKNINVLEHAMGYFKNQLSADEKQELLEVLDHYHTGHIPLIVPITLLNHYIRKYNQPYLQNQHYFHPHPDELKLRNHA